MREITIGNGELTVCFDAYGSTREIYYPRPGLWNHTLGAPSKMGVRQKGVTTWLDQAPLPRLTPLNRHAALAEWQDVHGQTTVTVASQIDPQLPILRRQVHITGQPKDKIGILIHHDFRLLETEYQDGVRFDAKYQHIHHYKRQQNFAVGICPGPSPCEFSWTLGRRDSLGGLGLTGHDDQEYLDNNPCAVGAGESILAVHLQLDHKGHGDVTSYLAAWQDHKELLAIAEAIDEPCTFIKKSPWAANQLSDLVNHSIQVMDVFEDLPIASPDTETLSIAKESYGYLWPRDGAFVAMTWDRIGNRAAAKKFYDFCARALSDEGFLHQRYHPDGTIGSSWHPDQPDDSRLRPIQEDSTALVCLAAARHILGQAEEDSLRELADCLVFPAASFLLSYRDETTGLPRPSHDLWEERFGIHTFTVAAVVAALRAANEVAARYDHPLAERFSQASESMNEAMYARLFHQDAGRFARMAVLEKDGGFHLDTTPDASLAGLFLFDEKAVENNSVQKTMASIEEMLWVGQGVGGIARYHDDHYHRRSLDPDTIPGNPWIICTLWMAHWHALKADHAGLKRSRELMEWVLQQARPGGALPEQVHPLTGENISVCPLLWSHSTLIDTYHAMNAKDA